MNATSKRTAAAYRDYPLLGVPAGVVCGVVFAVGDPGKYCSFYEYDPRCTPWPNCKHLGAYGRCKSADSRAEAMIEKKIEQL